MAYTQVIFTIVTLQPHKQKKKLSIGQRTRDSNTATHASIPKKRLKWDKKYWKYVHQWISWKQIYITQTRAEYNGNTRKQTVYLPKNLVNSWMTQQTLNLSRRQESSTEQHSEYEKNLCFISVEVGIGNLLAHIVAWLYLKIWTMWWRRQNGSFLRKFVVMIWWFDNVDRPWSFTF